MNFDDISRHGTMCFGYALPAEGTNDSTIKTTNAVSYMINGIMYTKAATDNIDPTACTEQAAAKTCLYLITVNASGTVDTIKGTEVASADLTAGTAVLVWPTPAADTCPIGAMKIATGTTAFTVGTDDITDDIGTGSVTFYSLGAIPARPMTS